LLRFGIAPTVRERTFARMPTDQNPKPSGLAALLKQPYARIALAIVALLLAGGTVAVVVDTDGPGPTPPRTITLVVNTTPGDGAPAQTIEVPAGAVRAVERSEVGDHVDSRDEAPAGTPPAQLDASTEAQDRIKATRDPLPTAGASQGFAGCKTQFISSFSSRNGVRPSVQVMHYTVSPNRPGWSDVDGITAFFSRASTQASSHFVIDREGNCAYIVPIESKAWTQAGGNPYAISYEIINTGSESPFMDSAGYAKLRSVVKQVAARTRIPLRRGAINGCAPSRSGLVQHLDGGSCWGGHHDISPFSIDAIVRLVERPAPPPTPLTVVEQRIVKGAAAPKRSGHSRAFWCRRNVEQRARLLRLGRARGWDKQRGGDRYQRLGASWKTHCR
jgi:hypothetical protein